MTQFSGCKDIKHLNPDPISKKNPEPDPDPEAKKYNSHSTIIARTWIRNTALLIMLGHVARRDPGLVEHPQESRQQRGLAHRSPGNAGRQGSHCRPDG